MELFEIRAARGAGFAADDVDQQPQDYPEGIHERAQVKTES